MLDIADKEPIETMYDQGFKAGAKLIFDKVEIGMGSCEAYRLLELFKLIEDHGSNYVDRYSS